MTATIRPHHIETAELIPTETTTHRPRRRGMVVLTILLVMVAQAMIAIGVAIGGDPLIGALSAAMTTICGMTLVFAAAQK